MRLSYAGDAREERRQGTVAPRTTGAPTFLPAVTGWDPEEARQLLDPVLERMMAAVHRYDGTVNQVMGDGIMALFEAPIAHEDHTVRAIGNDLHMDYSTIGQTTHLAARMEQLAPPGRIRLTAETRRLDMQVEGLVCQALDPPKRRRRTLAAIEGLTLRESQVQFLLLVFENLHWIDAETQAVLDSRIDSLRTARMLLLVNYRPTAISLLEQGLELCQAANIPFSFHRIALPLDAVYALSERVAEAVPPLEQTVEQAAPAGRGAGSDGPDRSALR
jgi:hypothetical protein